MGNITKLDWKGGMEKAKVKVFGGRNSINESI